MLASGLDYALAMAAFWKPGSERPSIPVDLDSGGEAGTPLFYNPKGGYSIDVQRRSLPIYEHRLALLYAIEMHGVVVVVGETGCGKSTRMFS